MQLPPVPHRKLTRESLAEHDEAQAIDFRVVPESWLPDPARSISVPLNNDREQFVTIRSSPFDDHSPCSPLSREIGIPVCTCEFSIKNWPTAGRRFLAPYAAPTKSTHSIIASQPTIEDEDSGSTELTNRSSREVVSCILSGLFCSPISVCVSRRSMRNADSTRSPLVAERNRNFSSVVVHLSPTDHIIR